MRKKRKKLHGKVQKVIKPRFGSGPEKAEISIDEADDLYKEIRVENVVTDEKGDKAALKPGDDVDIVLEAEAEATAKASDPEEDDSKER